MKVVERIRGGSLRSAMAGMAAGTAVSRFTGLLRILALAYALPLGVGGHLSDAYNLANNAPNQLYDVVLGGILSATFIPVFVERLAVQREEDAWRAISAVVTISAVVLLAATVLIWFLSPEVITALTALDRTQSAAAVHGLSQERAVATGLLRWFVPQIALYGLIALATALLNTQRRFVAPMWVPIANNLVCILVLLTFAAVVHHPDLLTVESHHWEIVLLGLGTTLGVVVQALLLIPSLRSANLGRLRWVWAPRHDAVRTVLRLSTWTFGFVLANQVALFISLALAVRAPGTAPVSAYMYAYTFFQMPFAVVAVSIMSAVTPGLAEQWSTGRTMAFRHRLTIGLRSTLAIIIPAAVGMLLLARPAIQLLLGHGASTAASTTQTGSTLAMFAIGLPGFCTFLYVVRVLQSMQRARTAFWLYLVENGLNVVLAIALLGPLGVRGLALSLSIAYTVAAALGLAVLRGWLGAFGDHETWAPLRRAGVASAAMGIVVLVVSNLSGSTSDGALFLRVVGAVAAGSATFLAVVLGLGSRHRRDGPWSNGPGGPPGPRNPSHGPTQPPDPRGVRLLARSGSGTRSGDDGTSGNGAGLAGGRTAGPRVVTYPAPRPPGGAGHLRAPSPPRNGARWPSG